MSSAKHTLKTDVVFVATDLGPTSDGVVIQAHERARENSKPLTVCFVIRHAMRSDPLLPGLRVEFENGLPVVRNRGIEQVRAQVARCTGRTDGEYEVVIEDGLPHARIVEAAESRRASLIVVGAHASEGHVHPLFGSVTERVVRHAHCPVLVVRSGPATNAILIATDFSDPAMPALAAAAEEARRRGARLTLLHSMEATIDLEGPRNDPLGEPPVGLPLDAFLALKEAAQARAQKLLDDSGLDGDVIIAAGPAGEAILTAATRVEAGLIFVGTKGRTGLARVVLGSVAETVVRDASCSVFVVRLNAGATAAHAG